MNRKNLLLSLLSLALLSSCSEKRGPADFVQVFNGTDLAGNTYPGATVPFGAVQLSPDTEGESASGYRYAHTQILGFSHTHLSGTGCPDFGDFLVTPGIDSVGALPLSHQNEKASPGYYKVVFPEQGVSAELTAWNHSGMHRYTFTGPGKRLVRIDARHSVGDWCHPTEVSLELTGQELAGYRQVDGWASGRRIYLSAAFSERFEDAVEEAPGVMLFCFPEGTKEVTLCAGLSGVDAEGARANRLAEMSDIDFDSAVKRASARWNQALGAIEVKGGPADVFYTNFYHTFLTPNRLEDGDGRYRDQEDRVRKLPSDRHFYSTLSLWDTFRAWHPLQTLLDTAMVADMVRSMLDDYDCRGQLPVWPLASDETGCMIGYHSVSVIADAWLRGIRDFDGEKALQAMIVSSNKNNANASELYNAYGYIPADMKIETVSQTLEFCYDDWCIARMAEALGHGDIAAEYDARSLRYRTLFDPATGFMRGKNTDGNWTEPFDQLSGSRDYTEATPWHYRFFMPHDLAGMEALLGGREGFYAALDSLFTYTPESQNVLDEGIGGILGQYAHGNEPGHHMPWLFHWAGAPSRTQETVRTILTEMYTTAPDGLCGNEDCGQMGAWYVLAALGIYPACPGSGEFQLTAPLFKETRLHLAGGNTLTIRADKPQYPYIEEVCLNGKPVNRHFVTYDEIVGGGELRFRLAPKPSRKRDALPAPYSLTKEPLVSPPAILGQLMLFPESAEVRMFSRTDGASIHYTLDGSEPTEASPLYTQPFQVSQSCVLKATAFKEGLPPSPVTTRTAHKLFFHPAENLHGLRPGCRYTYHTANFVLIGQIESDPPEAVGVMLEPSIAGAAAEDHFAYAFTGFIDIPESGIWHFHTTSDDGSALYIDGVCVVNNDGSHSKSTVEGKLPLEKGLHPYKLLYFEDYEGQSLEWGWKAPGKADYTPIPSSRLFYK